MLTKAGANQARTQYSGSFRLIRAPVLLLHPQGRGRALTPPSRAMASQLFLPVTPRLSSLTPVKPHFGHLQAGISVAIQRTDGRIHLAVITEVKRDNAWVTVEWAEKGVKKGKKVALETIFLLNPALALAGPAAQGRASRSVSLAPPSVIGDQRTAARCMPQLRPSAAKEIRKKMNSY